MEKVYRPRAIESIAQSVLMQYNPLLVNGDPIEIPIEEIIEVFYGIILQYRNLTKSGNIHGMTVFEKCVIPIFDDKNKQYEPILVQSGTILIDKRLLTKPNQRRLRFTLAHELAHYIIHSEHYSETKTLAEKISSDSDIRTEKEADELAAALLMPMGRLKVAAKRLSGKRNKKELIITLSDLFNVSTKAMEIRLERLGLA